MISSIWHSAIYQPLYNILILLVGVLPGHSVGGAIIVLTFIVKLAMYPLAGKAIDAQHSMRKLEPELKKIRETHKDDKQKQAKHTLELYQKHQITPLSGCLPLLIQIPVIIGLYWVFFKGLAITPELLYGFVTAPGYLDMQFLMFDLGQKSLFLALLAAVSQYIQVTISMPKTIDDGKKNGERTLQEDFARSMQIQMRYVLPVMIGFIAYQSAAAVALYWATSNILSIVQEILMRRRREKKDLVTA